MIIVVGKTSQWWEIVIVTDDFCFIFNRNFLCLAVHWFLCESGYANNFIRHPATRGKANANDQHKTTQRKCSFSVWLSTLWGLCSNCISLLDPDQGLGHSVCGWSGVLPGQRPHRLCGQCVQCWLCHPSAGTNHPQKRSGHQEPGWGLVRPWGHRSQHAGKESEAHFKLESLVN